MMGLKEQQSQVLQLDPIIVEAWKNKALKPTALNFTNGTAFKFKDLVSGDGITWTRLGKAVMRGRTAKSVRFTMNGKIITSRKEPVQFTGLDEAHRIANLSLADRVREYLRKGFWTVDHIAEALDENRESVAAQLRRFRKQGLAESRVGAGKSRLWYAASKAV